MMKKLIIILNILLSRNKLIKKLERMNIHIYQMSKSIGKIEIKEYGKIILEFLMMIANLFTIE
jgi:hypothetical protein